MSHRKFSIKKSVSRNTSLSNRHRIDDSKPESISCFCGDPIKPGCMETVTGHSPMTHFYEGWFNENGNNKTEAELAKEPDKSAGYESWEESGSIVEIWLAVEEGYIDGRLM